MVGDASAAGRGDGDPLHRAFIAGDGQHFHDVFVRRIAAKGQLHPLVDDGALLVYAAAHGGFALGNDLLRDGKRVLWRQRVVKGELCHLFEHLVLQFLNVRIEKRHHRQHPLPSHCHLHFMGIAAGRASRRSPDLILIIPHPPAGNKVALALNPTVDSEKSNFSCIPEGPPAASCSARRTARCDPPPDSPPAAAG